MPTIKSLLIAALCYARMSLGKYSRGFWKISCSNFPFSNIAVVGEFDYNVASYGSS